MKKVAIDCRMLECSGIGTFLSGILPHIISNKSLRYILIGSSDIISQFKQDNVDLFSCNIKPFSLTEYFRFPVKIINTCDCFFSPNYNIPQGIKIPIVSTIHDILFLDNPEYTSRIGFFIRKFAILRALRISSLVYTVSQFSRERLISVTKTNTQIRVCYNGADSFTRLSSKLTIRPTPNEYFIFVGNIKPHKGLNILLDAFNLCNNKDKKLVIVGKKDTFKTPDKSIMKRIENMVSSGDVIFTGRIDKEILNSYLANAYALIQPSTYEGFGLPPLESMNLGTPVILSDIPVFKEIYSPFPVIFFKNKDVRDLANKMDFQLKRIALNENLKNKYSYRTTASRINDGIQDALMISNND